MRLQGTDGIRGVVKTAKELKATGKTSLGLFLESGWLTEEFFELYGFGVAEYLLRSGKVKKGEELAIGWDPRDLAGIFTSRVVAGIRKAGLNAMVLGTVPTPMVPIYMAAKGLQAGMAITASHNPADQNGIKIFLTPEGLKPTPKEEENISHAIADVNPEKLKTIEETGKLVDCWEEALLLFQTFHKDRRNSWDKEGNAYESIRLVVDASNGACSGMAAELFRSIGFKELIEVSANPEDGINENCGVVGFENISSINQEYIEGSGKALAKNKFVREFFQLGGKYRQDIMERKETVVGVVFDGDGDRFNLVVYNPFQNELVVLSGDEIAVHMAKYLITNDSDTWQGALFVHTVESDLQSSIEASTLGFAIEKTGVGDKWLLRRAMEFGSRFAVGSERSGHVITAGYLENHEDKSLCIFAGNGVKGALNSIAALTSLYGKFCGEDWIEALRKPFLVGFNEIRHIYYTDKGKWMRGSRVWKEAKPKIVKLIETAFGKDGEVKEKVFQEEPDLFYLEIRSASHILKASLHVRNSGTEDKTGITVKGLMENKSSLSDLTDKVFKLLAGELKKPSHPYCLAQNKLIHLLNSDGMIPRQNLPHNILKDGSFDRLLREVGQKEGMVRETASGFELTDLGRWYFLKCLGTEAEGTIHKV